MATTFTQFGGTALAAASISKPIGGTAAAGDWLSITTGAIDGFGVSDPPVITDDASGSTGWESVADFTSSEGGDSFRTTTWRKLCVGGETSVTATWPGAVDLAAIGFWLATPTQPFLYVLDQGPTSFDGTYSRFDSANPPQTNAESYYGVIVNGRGDLTFGALDPPETGALFAPNNGFTHVLGLFNTDEGSNTVADVVGLRVQPNRVCYVVLFGIGPEVLDLAGTGELLISGTVELEASGGSTNLAGTGELLIGGAVPLEQEGGDAHLSTLGRLLVGGRVPLSAPPPFPPQPPTPAMTGQLDCGIYDVFIFTRGLRTIVGRIPFNQLNWSRVLDDTSSAEVTVDGVSNTGAMARCCQLLGSIEPWQHEIGIYRNGQRVWSGPVVHVSYPSETVIIDAADLSAWLSVRYLHQNHNFVSPNADLANNWLALVDDAMSVDNSAGLFAIVQELTGVQGERLYTQDMGVLAADAVSELARTGLDWSCVDRRMVGGPVAQQPPAYPDAQPLPTLIDESFRDAPTIDRDGNLMANSWFVGGSGSGPGGAALIGVYGPEWPGPPDYPDHVFQAAAPDYAAIQDRYGRIERRVNETKILDQPSIDQNAATRYDLTKLPVDVISSGTLLPSAGIDIRQLLPGSLQNIHLTRACVQIGAPYRLKQLTVTAASDGSEDVEGAWEPIGSVAAHEDLG